MPGSENLMGTLVAGNIIGERVLGLPVELRADKGMPFNEIPTGSS